MAHLLVFGACAPCTPAAALVAALERQVAPGGGGRLSRVSWVDLAKGPVFSRWRAATGLGWQARDLVRRVHRGTGVPVDAVLEIGDVRRRHVMGLGRLGIPALRWSWAEATDAADAWVDRQAALDGTPLWFAHPDRAQRAPEGADAWLPFAIDARQGTPQGSAAATVLSADAAPARLWVDAVDARFGPLAPLKTQPCARAAQLDAARLVVHLDPGRVRSDVLFAAVGAGARVVSTPLGPLLGGVFRPGVDIEEVGSVADVARVASEAPHGHKDADAARDRLGSAHTYDHRARQVLRRLVP